jgi:peptidoglycan/LPS O-acetylase OafA/YrhL
VGTGKVVQAGEVRSARIESLRAVAALAVLSFHILQFTSGPLAPVEHAGRLGVFLFFALTGYLLFVPFARHLYADGKPVDIARYARNRALRILPLYYAVLVILLVLGHGGGTPTEWLRFGTLTQSFFGDTVLNDVDIPMWSLAVELQFYVLLPLLALAFGWLLRTPARAAAAIGLMAAASVAVWELKVFGKWPGAARWGYSLPANLFAFTPGMLLALMRLELGKRPALRLPSSTLLIAAAVAVWVGAAYLDDRASLIAAPASFLLLAAVVLPVLDGRAARLLDLRVLTVIGVASYSLYLWHVPLIKLIARHADLSLAGLLALSLVVCVPLALLSYAIVERQFLRRRSRWGSTVADQAVPASPAPISSALPSGQGG